MKVTDTLIFLLGTLSDRQWEQAFINHTSEGLNLKSLRCYMKKVYDFYKIDLPEWFSIY